MKILGIDTATDILAIAITDDKTLITECRSNIRRAHAEKLINAIDHVLIDASLKLSDIAVIAVGTGPGSFTGLRIGIAAVKGLAFAANIPVVSVSSLDALALQAGLYSHQICPLVKAQGDEAYTALYHAEQGKAIRKTDYQVIALDQLERFITQKTLIINVGMKNLSGFITEKLEHFIEIAPPANCLASGYFICLLGYEKFLNNEFEDIDKLEPFYLKDFKAKKSGGI
ncbi:tRNA (adenosine(37)-N6)-threonylcarbamoyltransferase complex dimerization subunit type 1 TsaB [candidate division KSB1 bacterium]|nr:tRNA (adenosine(37)-N6)-threonylcarbamoyltransferase complex dimerization subunit type 1 TsaB [candidate division KSB1 bacterium]